VATVTLLDVSSSDDDETEVPASWTAGTVITVDAPDAFTVVNAGGYSVIYGQFAELVPVVGKSVTLGLTTRTTACSSPAMFRRSQQFPEQAVPLPA
jgi:hypothetical protein